MDSRREPASANHMPHRTTGTAPPRATRARASHAAPWAIRSAPANTAGKDGEERDLQTQGRQADEQPGGEPSSAGDRPQRTDDEQRHRRLLARAVRGVVDEAVEG